MNDFLNDKEEDLDFLLEFIRNEKSFENLKKVGSGLRLIDDLDIGI